MVDNAVLELILATGNSGKIVEFQALLGPRWRIKPQAEFGVPSIEETGTTFLANALQKARHAAEHTGRPALADDSGLEVDALKGAPGIHSARYAGSNADDAANNARLLADLAGVPESDRTARFRCILVWVSHSADPAPLIAEGVWEGRVLHAPRGRGGFGYDALFYDPELKASAAEMSPQLKNEFSHRGKAIGALRALLGRLAG